MLAGCEKRVDDDVIQSVATGARWRHCLRLDMHYSRRVFFTIDSSRASLAPLLPTPEAPASGAEFPAKLTRSPSRILALGRTVLEPELFLAVCKVRHDVIARVPSIDVKK